MVHWNTPIINSHGLMFHLSHLCFTICLSKTYYMNWLDINILYWHWASSIGYSVTTQYLSILHMFIKYELTRYQYFMLTLTQWHNTLINQCRIFWMDYMHNSLQSFREKTEVLSFLWMCAAVGIQIHTCLSAWQAYCIQCCDYTVLY